MTTLAQQIKRSPRPGFARPLPIRAVPIAPAPEPAWREDVRHFFFAYFAGLVAFGTMLA